MESTNDDKDKERHRSGMEPDWKITLTAGGIIGSLFQAVVRV